MTMDERTIDAAARHLQTLLAAGRAGSRLPADLRPQTPEDGWRIQRRLSALRDRPVVGWKCGLPPGDRWVAAALHEAVPSGASVRAPLGPNGAPRIEPELAFTLGRDLPPRERSYTPEEVNAAIGSVRLAIEVLGCRYQDAAPASGPELMADSLWHQTLVLGPQLDDLPSPSECALTIRQAGQGDRTVSARHTDGDPRRPLHWLAEFLRAQGVGLDAGQSVITGSLAGAIDLPFDHPATLRYGDWGEVALTLRPL